MAKQTNRKTSTTTRTKSHAQLQKDLHKYLDEAFDGIEIDVGISDRWQRPCITLRWSGIEGLLPEERVRRVTQHIPAAFFEAHCRGIIWLELAPEESVDEFLAWPRSEDVVDRLDKIQAKLVEMNFFAALEDELVRVAVDPTGGDLSVTRRVLDAKKATAKQQQDALLAIMHHRAYTDWEVLRTVRPIVEQNKGKKK